MLPTDERFKKLTDKQKVLLFESFINMPPDHVIYESANRKKGGMLDKKDLDHFRTLGYSDEQLKRIQENLHRAFEE